MVGNTFKISEENLKTLESLLSTVSIILFDDIKYKDELNEIYKLIPALKPNTNDSHLLPHIGKNHSVIRYYTKKNKKLNNYFRFLFNNQNIELFVISEVTYTPGGFALPHKDPDSKMTYNVMLEDNFEGGEVYLEGVLQDFKKRGDVVFFDGGKQSHSVSEITKGKRKILSIWTKPTSLM